MPMGKPILVIEINTLIYKSWNMYEHYNNSNLSGKTMVGCIEVYSHFNSYGHIMPVGVSSHQY